MRSIGVLVVLLAACGDNTPPASPDAPGDARPPIDAPEFPACREFRTEAVAVPAHVTGSLSGADLTSPASCASVDAPYGIESAGPDSVVKLSGLVAGTSYVVEVTSASDLAFYVVTGCTTPTGPSASDCLLFEDAHAAGSEVGRFVAKAPVAYVVVDYYASHAPPDPTFTLDAYLEECTTDAQCGGATPVCDEGRCVECETSFDCALAARPRCDQPSHTCMAGVDACLTDDPGEPANDGPAGAVVLAPDAAGNAASSGLICSAPSGEADFIAFDVTAAGDVWDFALAWNGTADLDLELFDARGNPFGLSFWEHPEHVRLTYLAPGRYFVRVSEFSASPDASPVNYSVSAHRTPGPGCTARADCAAEFRNQLYRGSCQAGACVDLAGASAVPEGGACDSESDCAPGLDCPSFFFVANADTRDVCARTCSGDADCAPLGGAYVCSTYFVNNFCVQKCTDDSQCPTAIGSTPTTGPWDRLTCDLPTGRCLP